MANPDISNVTELNAGTLAFTLQTDQVTFLMSTAEDAKVDSAQTFREFALKYGSLKPDYHPDEKSHELFSEYIEERL